MSLSPGDVRLVLWLTPLASVAIGLGQSVLFATMPMLGRQLGFHELQITSLVSLSALVFFIVSPFWGRHSDIIGRRRTILIGISGYTLGTLVFIAIVQFGLNGVVGGLALYGILLFYRVFHTGLMAATHPACGAYVADVTAPSERTAGLTRLAAAMALGTVLGPGLIYFARYGLLMPIYLTVAFCALALLCLWRWLPGRRPARGDGPMRRLRYWDPRIRTVLLVGFGMYAALAMAQQTLGFYFQDRLQLATLDAVRLFAFGSMALSLATIAVQLLVVPQLGWSPALLIRLGLPTTILGYVGIAVAWDFTGLCIAMFVCGIGMGLAGPGYTASASLRVAPWEQGSLAGLSASIPGLGFVVGPLLGGLLYGMDPRLPYLGAALILAPLAAYCWWRLSDRYGAVASEVVAEVERSDTPASGVV